VVSDMVVDSAESTIVGMAATVGSFLVCSDPQTRSVVMDQSTALQSMEAAGTPPHCMVAAPLGVPCSACRAG